MANLEVWTRHYLQDGGDVDLLEDFWVIPVNEDHPEFENLVAVGIETIRRTRVIAYRETEEYLTVIFADADGKKVIVFKRDLALFGWDILGSNELTVGRAHFLQVAYMVGRFKIPASSLISRGLVASSPIFEDDIVGHFPSYLTFKLEGDAIDEEEWMTFVKVGLLIELKHAFVSDFQEKIVLVAAEIPSDGHDWIFEQLMAAFQSGRLASLYLELYKIFEFFFPLDNIYKLADRLGYLPSELELLEHCRGALSWNVNHQKGARSAILYASVAFAECCLNESYDPVEDESLFKSRAIEKMTTARHALTHQDFKAVSIPSSTLEVYVDALLIFLKEAFRDYSARRRQRQSATGR
ncbi:hypothetical protein [Pseudomonas sp. SLFW]|uniref:hypothetical protein n=1 Tax=Pseudomonas sp. SLFW TaxID=2683259 RepID=UPI0014137813|nr:hypothetical protein [Pseudomonas sp. SLFW]NBB09518.1 hypothetical protein [Pseudomonas sp. SLFW]